MAIIRCRMIIIFANDLDEELLYPPLVQNFCDVRKISHDEELMEVFIRSFTTIERVGPGQWVCFYECVKYKDNKDKKCLVFRILRVILYGKEKTLVMKMMSMFGERMGMKRTKPKSSRPLVPVEHSFCRAEFFVPNLWVNDKERPEQFYMNYYPGLYLNFNKFPIHKIHMWGHDSSRLG